MDQFVAELRKIPPITRFLCGSSLAVTIPVLMNIVAPYKLLFVRELVMKKFQVRCHVFGKPKRRLTPIGVEIVVQFLFREWVAWIIFLSGLESKILMWAAFTGGGINYIFELVML